LSVALLLVLLAAVPVRGERGGAATRDSFDIARLVDALADPDFVVRQQAGDRLALMGPAARPELIRASRSEDPERRNRAADVLRKLPWSAPDDPPAIRQLLEHYGPAPDAGRQRVIVRIVDLDGGGKVLLRLLDEEPSDAVRWLIVATLFDTTDPQITQRMRDVDENNDDAPALMLAARAWFDRDRARALRLFRRAVDADQLRPSNDQGVLAIAYDQLTDAALAQGKLDEAADLLRRQVPRDTMLARFREEYPFAASGGGGVSLQRLAALLASPRRDPGDSRVPNLAALAAMHRYFGPLRGFESDRRTWGRDRAGDATALLATRATALLSQLGCPPPLPAADEPFALSADDHYAAAAFLAQHKFTDAAELELRETLTPSRPSAPRGIKPATEFNALYLLARLVAEDGRDDESADLVERAFQVKQHHNLELNDGAVEDDIRLEIHWRRARAAQTRGDVAAAETHARDLVQCLPGNNDLTISAIRWLQETGRNEPAKALFEKVYQIAHDRLVAGGLADGEPGANNDLAWLCARCGERLDEAIKLAQAAVDASPETAAYIDTLAEANYRKGNCAEAVRLETKALSLSPDNEFMKKQLQRYKSGQP
jgi:tetratricopeptide (TPR) repeat protein